MSSMVRASLGKRNPQQNTLLGKIFLTARFHYQKIENRVTTQSADCEILHRLLDRRRDDARRGSAVNFREETDIHRTATPETKARSREQNAATCEVRLTTINLRKSDKSRNFVRRAEVAQ